MRKESQRQRVFKYQEENLCDNAILQHENEVLSASEESDEWREISEDENLSIISVTFSEETEQNTKPSTSQIGVKLPFLAYVCDRKAATIVSAVFHDIGMIKETDSSKVIDRSQIRRERKKNRETLDEESNYELQSYVVKGLYFDGKKDMTIIQEKQGNRYHRRTVLEKHITLIAELESKYLGHVTPKTGSVQNIAKTIVRFFRDKSLNFSNLTNVGCDGTVVNTGNKNGIITLLEKEARKPLQWLICMFHGNELPLRHLFKYLDGKTTGPNDYAGDIGKQLHSCESLPVVNFQLVEGNLPDMLSVFPDLSTDQKYLLEICMKISSGTCSQELANRNPGKLSHSKWLTTPNRILRYCVSKENPSENLSILASYVVKVYAPVWFHIKLNPSCVHGSRRLFKLIQFSHYLPEEPQKIVDAVIQRNGYFASPENILLGMLTDDKKCTRELGLRRIQKQEI